jgi:hypothetical protein
MNPNNPIITERIIINMRYIFCFLGFPMEEIIVPLIFAEEIPPNVIIPIPRFILASDKNDAAGYRVI